MSEIGRQPSNTQVTPTQETDYRSWIKQKTNTKHLREPKKAPGTSRFTTTHLRVAVGDVLALVSGTAAGGAVVVITTALRKTKISIHGTTKENTRKGESGISSPPKDCNGSENIKSGRCYFIRHDDAIHPFWVGEGRERESEGGPTCGMEKQPFLSPSWRLEGKHAMLWSQIEPPMGFVCQLIPGTSSVLGAARGGPGHRRRACSNANSGRKC